MKKNELMTVGLLCGFAIGLQPAEPATPPTPVYPAAIFAFEERGAGVKGLGAKASDILFA